MWNALALSTVLLAQPAPTIQDICQPALKDVSLTVKVVKGDQKELGKISKDFGQTYRFKSTLIRIKDPFKVRAETRVDDTDILYILNGDTKVYRIPRAKISRRESLKGEPGKRQSFFDFGVLTPSLFGKDFFTGKFVRIDRASGDYVFDLTYDPAVDTSRNRVWIDPEKRYITRREWYTQDGHQRATFQYGEPKKFGNVWVPTQTLVKNVDGKVAAESRYENIQVNAGLADSLFNVD